MGGKDTGIAAWLRDRRINAGLTQLQLAEQARVSLRAVRNAERGYVRCPRTETTKRLLAALDAGERAVTAESPDPMRFGVLGPLTILDGQRRIEVRAEKQRLLLALLAVQPNRVVRREEIVDLLWRDGPPPSCRNLVHTYAARLRKTLEFRNAHLDAPPTIVAVSGGYLMAVSEDQLDLLTFDAAREAGERALALGDLPLAERHLRHALQQWRGSVLADLDQVRQHPACLALAARRSETVVSYADVALAQGERCEAAVHLRALIVDEPLHEAAYARLMLALAVAGQQAAALKLYDDIRKRLSDDLGIEPGSELRQAQLRVLRQDIQFPSGATIAGSSRDRGSVYDLATSNGGT